MKIYNFFSKKTILRSSFLLLIIFCISLFLPYNFDSNGSRTILDRYGHVMYRIKDEYRQSSFSGIDQVPLSLTNFLIAQEDRRFFYHPGIDFLALLRSFWKTMHGFRQGGSTIDQQVIKLDKMAFKRSWYQKIFEQWSALRLNLYYSKSEILLRYINTLYFPNGVKGYSLACEAFFGKSCEQLGPEYFVWLYVKSRYPHKKNISPQAYELLLRHHKIFDISVDDLSGVIQRVADEEGWYLKTKMPWYVQTFLSTYSGSSSIISTPFDPDLYNRIETILAQYEPLLNQKQAYDACVVVLENGQLRSSNSLRHYGSSGTYINPCLSPRQVGSALKPFLYAYAFAHYSYTGGSLIEDEPVSYSTDLGNYLPKNFDLDYHGTVTLAQALGSSLNIPAVKLLHQVGVGSYYDFLRTIGLRVGTTDARNDSPFAFGLSLALGSKDISPLDFARMWEVFNGCSLKKQNDDFCEIYGDAFHKVVSILSNNNARLLSFPANNWFTAPNTFAKSGTSRNFVDGRVCGGKKTFTVCVRVGNLNASSMLDAGHGTAGVIWYHIMNLL